MAASEEKLNNKKNTLKYLTRKLKINMSRLKKEKITFKINKLRREIKKKGKKNRILNKKNNLEIKNKIETQTAPELVSLLRNLLSQL